MTKKYLLTLLVLCSVLFAFTTAGFAQTKELAANVTADQPGKTADQPLNNDASKSEAAAKTDGAKSKTEAMLASAMETNKEIENPATALWLLQTTMDNSLENVGFKKGYYNHSHLQFEPLLPNEINKHWTIGFRPVLDFYNSQAYPDASLAKPVIGANGVPTGLSMPVKRMTSFGDMTLGIGVNPDPGWVHNWILCQGVTFIFPTATHNVLGQNNWQAGPLEAIGHKGKHDLGYVLQQTWWKIGGDGQRTRQTWVRYTYFYNWTSGWSLGTQSDMFVNWQANRDQRLYFPVGLQVGKLVHAGPLPVKVDMQAQYYAVRPSYFHNTMVTPIGAISGVPTTPLSPKWNFQLQFTPIIPTIQEIIHHQIPVDPTRKH